MAVGDERPGSDAGRLNGTRASRLREAIRGTLVIGERREAVERAEMAAAEELNPGKKIETQR